MGEAKRRGTFEERKRKSNFTCIICRHEKVYTERSDEHVIPDSLNGYYHIYNVCKSCNSNMGSNVDGVLLNHKITQLYRFSEQIKGKSGNLPNPFKETRAIKDQPETRIRTEVSDGKLLTKFVQDVTFVKNEDGTIKSFHISCDASDGHKVKEIQKQIIKKYGLDEAKLITTTQVHTIDNPVLEGTWEIDSYKYKMGLLKIAYEFAIDSIPRYFNDQTALLISKILLNSDYEKLADLKMNSSFHPETFKFLEDIIDLKIPRHILILTCVSEGLICFIKLENSMHFAIHLSNNQYIEFENSIVGINDLENNKFYKKTFSEFIKSQKSEKYHRLEYFIPYDNNPLDKILKIKSPNFKNIDSKHGVPKLYNHTGNLLSFSFHDLLNKSHHVRSFSNNEMIVKFTFPRKLRVFVKSLKTGSLSQVIGYETSVAFFKM
ncbi:HNH endonuclease [Acinetobacter baumannii]|uniref:HNH endonuclease n=1 Tax=Acinetobacter baumannii TaxID=470 RepID=UPI00135637B1|nr:HNH endonuclease [Acinetobacter baumannii]MCT9166994.1 HNH endonuclease [Acinetobacter baumannii]MCT9174470.1 HNH endonuclease [Acinetobacter baumannii]MCT9178746.1 HNH endonuclease [Acinetobacter baumannii]